MLRPLILLAISGATLFLASLSAGAQASPVHGDADCDGVLTPSDALAILSQTGCDGRGDTDCDGLNLPADAVRLLRFLAGLDHSHLPGCPPIGEPGDSPTPTSALSPPPAPTRTPTPTPAPTPTASPAPTPTPTPTPSPSPTAQPPRTSGEPACEVFPHNNWWNTDISALPIHPQSDTYVDAVGRWQNLHPDFGTVWEGRPIGIPYVIVGPNQPDVSVSFYYEDESDPGPYPIPPNAPVEGQPVGQPNTADFGGDRHVIVIDESGCTLYETFDSRPVNGGQTWEAGSGAVFDLGSNNLRPDYWTSADAAGLPIFPGLVRYSEVVEEGVIDHALRFTAAQTRRAFIHPATHYASSNTDPALPPMGLRFRMKASYDCSWASAEVQVICTALKRYGMFVADNGSDWYVSGAPDPRWDDDRIGDLKDIPGDAFEVVDTGEPVIE
jgi:hypothetical protein